MNRLAGVDLQEYLEFCSSQESQSFRDLADASDLIWERLENGPMVNGAPMPWSKTESLIRFRPCEVTVWAGVNGHGKSAVIGQCSLDWLADGPVCQASFEMPMPALGARLCTQALGTAEVTRDAFLDFMNATTSAYWVYDETDTVKTDRVYAMAIYAAKELHCNHVVVDSMVKCGLGGGEKGLERQEAFVDRLSWIAKTYETHIHIVHHMRKGESESRPGTKFDVKGSGAVTDLADNVILVWRNKGKEEMIEAGEAVAATEPDTVLTVAKQRNGEWEGKIKLWFDVRTKQYVQAVHARPEPMRVAQGQGTQKREARR